MHRRGSDLVRSAVAFSVISSLLTALPSVLVPGRAAAEEPVAQPDAHGEGEAAVSFAESWGCGAPATLKPFASKKGVLSSSEAIRGPAGDFLGRDIGDVWGSLVDWEVPLTDGKTVKVHERALPAFELVTANLAAAVDAGLDYEVDSVGTYNPRTIGGSYRFSFHAFGTAVDINPSRNPYRGDNVLVTDMPEAFVQAFRDAGFCWGGDWQTIKDPMHFAWMGPAFTPGYGEPPPMYPVKTSPAAFTEEVFDRATPLGSPEPGELWALADGNGDAAADVFRVTDHPVGLMIEYALSSSGHAWCAVSRRLATSVHLEGRSVVFGDAFATGRLDLWLVDSADGSLAVEILSRASEYASSTIYTPGHAVAPDARFVTGDFDRDTRTDLYVITQDADTTTVDVFGGVSLATLLHSASLPIGGTSEGDWSFSVGDHDLDGGPDLFALEHDAGVVHVLSHASGYTVSSEVAAAVPGTVTDFVGSDFDGDGRVDLQYIDGNGRHRAYLGNEATFASAWGWFWAPDFACDGSPFDGLFADDDGNEHEPDIDIIALAGVTFGCNPPENTLYCPSGDVTRGQMAAFFNRMLGLEDPKADWFSDDDASVFESDINAIADAGITYGCNPPDNTWFCPGTSVTRGQMAAFLVRALGIEGSSVIDHYADDAGSVFEADINKLADAGVAFGCSLGDETNYCPEQVLARDHMATFLARALDYLFGGGD